MPILQYKAMSIKKYQKLINKRTLISYRVGGGDTNFNSWCSVDIYLATKIKKIFSKIKPAKSI